MGELTVGAHPAFLEQRAVALRQTALAKHLLASIIQLVDDRHVPAVCVLALLLWPVDVSAVMKEVPEPLFEACLRMASEKSVERIGAQVAIPTKELEKLDIALRQFDALADAGAAHAGAALSCLHRLGGNPNVASNFVAPDVPPFGLVPREQL
jgi:hypothetical protein